VRLVAGVRHCVDRRRLVCREVVELMTDHLEGALGRRVRRRFEAHLAACAACAAYLAQMRATVAAVARVQRHDLPGAVRDELAVLARRRRALRAVRPPPAGATP